MFIRRLLLSLLGFKAYLQTISLIFLRTYLLGIFLPAHRQVRFLGRLVRKGDTCIDIGANLGYFSVPLSHWAGPGGRVLSVEPVPDFREVLLLNAKVLGLGNIEVLPYALGAEDGKEVMLATPKVDGVVRHGRTEVVEKAGEDAAKTHTAIMRTPQALFGQLAQLHFIKCDVEGYEIHIVPHLLPIIEKFRPIMEIEIAPLAHKESILGQLLPLGYRAFFLDGGRLSPFDLRANQQEIELYFLPEEQLATYEPLMK